MDEIINKINFVGERVFYNPTPLIDYEMLIKNSTSSKNVVVCDKLGDDDTDEEEDFDEEKSFSQKHKRHSHKAKKHHKK